MEKKQKKILDPMQRGFSALSAKNDPMAEGIVSRKSAMRLIISHNRRRNRIARLSRRRNR